jgi:elongation factor Ts
MPAGTSGRHNQHFPVTASVTWIAADIEPHAPSQAEDDSEMATITAAMVKDLRESTGAGMMDCKAALTESDGDMQAAQDWLRKKGLSKAAKKAGRVAAEGLIAALTKDTKGVVVEVNSETDFVARNEHFQGLVKMIAQVALDVGADLEKIKAAKVGNVTVETAIADAIATIGENMTLRRAAALEVGKGVVSSYVHNAVVEGAGKMGVIVALESPGKADELAVLGKQLAMHVAAANPLAIDPTGLDPATVKREKDVLADKYRQQGKPENVIEKIVESGLKTYYKEVCLLEQAFIHDSGKSVAQAIKEAEGRVGGPIKVAGFLRYALGEGIEKQESDFAAEVAAASGQK